MADITEWRTRIVTELMEHGAYPQNENLAESLVNTLEALLQQVEVETEKAYGGCHKCYGKGYATARIGTSSRYGNVTHDTIIYCTCNRGKQLKALKATSPQPNKKED